MQSEQHRDTHAPHKEHNAEKSTTEAALPGGNYAQQQTVPINKHQEPEEPQPSQPLYKYGLISLFDGCASTHDLITEAAGTAPTIFIAAENDPEIRQYVGARNKWNLDGEWFRKGTSYYRYLTDVDQLVDNTRHPLHRCGRHALPGPYYHWQTERCTRTCRDKKHLLLHLPLDAILPTRSTTATQDNVRPRECRLDESRIQADYSAGTRQQRTATTPPRT